MPSNDKALHQRIDYLSLQLILGIKCYFGYFEYYLTPNKDVTLCHFQQDY